MPQRARAHEEQVVQVTTAKQTRSSEIAGRERRYIISMTIRTLCFIGAYLVGDNWLRWVLVAASFVLPYVAVVAANTRGTLTSGDPEDPDFGRQALGPGRP